ncbi:response regulator transcription factor [Microbacterium gorillae]|uniref:response regulator transcription factor n=1 Tax=Microbacterium gorillae TaxID=1231063 RepID=UPI00058CF87E|nr:response regulator [Microbacterium gorillae]
MTRLQTLIVEDDADVAAVTRGFVQRHEAFTVAGMVGTGHGALEAVKVLRPRVVLLDVHLPDLSGIAVLRTIRAHGYTGEVIAVTASSEVDTVRRARQLGVRHYLVKPFTMAALHGKLDAVRDALRSEAGLGAVRLDQQAVDALLAERTAPIPTVEGSALTLDRVARALAAVPEGASATDIADSTGMSRVSARRYLQRLVDTGAAQVEPRYGTAGRPELVYRPSVG